MGNVVEKETFAGNMTDPEAFLLIEFWGSWGYHLHCEKMIKAVEAIVPGKYQYHMIRDTEVSGRFEVTLYKSLTDI